MVDPMRATKKAALAAVLMAVTAEGFSPDELDKKLGEARKTGQ